MPNNTYLMYPHLLCRNRIFLVPFGNPALFSTTSAAILWEGVTLRLNFRLTAYVSRQYLWAVRWENGHIITSLLEVFTQRNFVGQSLYADYSIEVEFNF